MSRQRRRHTPDAAFDVTAAFARETEQPAPQQPHKEYSDGDLDV